MPKEYSLLAREKFILGKQQFESSSSKSKDRVMSLQVLTKTYQG